VDENTSVDGGVYHAANAAVALGLGYPFSRSQILPEGGGPTAGVGSAASGVVGGGAVPSYPAGGSAASSEPRLPDAGSQAGGLGLQRQASGISASIEAAAAAAAAPRAQVKGLEWVEVDGEMVLQVGDEARPRTHRRTHSARQPPVTHHPRC